METYSVKQIADMLGTNPETVRRWIRDKKMDSVQVSRKDGNVVTEAELQRFLKASPKYLPRFNASIAAMNPAVSIPLIIGSFIGTKFLAYHEEKKDYDVRIRPEDLEKYLTEAIAQNTESLRKKKASLKQLENEIQTEEQQLAQLQYLLSHKEMLPTGGKDKSSNEDDKTKGKE